MIRPAHDPDASALATILSDWVDATPWMPRLHTRAEDLAFVSSLVSAGQVMIAEHDGQPAGYLARDGEEIRHLYVARDQQGRGVGRALIDQAKSGFTELGLWCFQANSAALAFYAKQGFAEDHRTDGRDNEERLPDIRLVWHREGVAA